ncbi:TetR/AcrR family transcriptional regulator [Mycolicibacterium komossense]|uniref:TetR/AcrR family transcriptional regulator n=1 Tax=Mycolicibacterium komossense TaxID=1779 RepID=A0ABT3CFQ6_9MYCO|nr:TetR/AcrR family transcriptional regulator [Mycolicibacterium komossense]MCV7228251.1 TetR/AcrR family transcriptional regulator [Mycolicibacterium komossense]
MVVMAQVRSYRGVEAPERLAQRRSSFLDAGLELLGGAAAPDELTVRAVCQQAGLALRYFYESFTDKDTFVAEVVDTVTAGLAATTQAAVAAAPLQEQNRAGITNIVSTIAADPRIGRLLFSARLSNAIVLRKRSEHGGLFAMLSGEHIQAALRVEQNSRVSATAHFVVGGVSQTISAWLAGEIPMETGELVDQLTSILDGFADPALYRG